MPVRTASEAYTNAGVSVDLNFDWNREGRALVPRRRKSALPPVALGGVVEEPELPLRYVEYPGLYGTFFRFAASADGPFHFCDCARAGLTNLAELQQRQPPPNNADPRRLAPLSNLYVPNAAASASIGWTKADLDRLEYGSHVCHRCVQIPPRQRWCHEMYGDPWKQAYGWFPYQAALEGGVDPWRVERFLAEVVPEAVRPDLEDYVPLAAALAAALRAGAAQSEQTRLARRAQTVKSRVMRYFTSEARVAFGFRRVGEGWVSETMLYQLVQLALPGERLIRHYRDEWLEGLELDIYAPALNLGIEYQGAQHSEPIEHWGGAAALERQLERDERKRELCRQAGCQLIEVWAGTELTRQSVRMLLEDAGVACAPEPAAVRT